MIPTVDMMSLRPQMAGGIDGTLRLESNIREAEALRRPLQLSDVRLEDFDAVYLPGGHLLRGRRRSAAVPAGTGNDDNRFRDAAGTRLLQAVTCSTTSVPISRPAGGLKSLGTRRMQHAD
ncbi:hypothetical protein ACFROC_13535 [Nocardia tengchongensis]|uniref:hypothetical protein n=1 Tax=Nocardia tengchongensis TaxID=2055889 RepID=UPI0036A2B981